MAGVCPQAYRRLVVTAPPQWQGAGCHHHSQTPGGTTVATSTTTITGNLTRTPVLKQFEPSKSDLVSMRVAVNRRVLKDDKWIDGDAAYITVEAWGSLARHCRVSLDKGMPVIATGHLVTTEWQVTGEEKPRTQLVLKASSIGLDLTYYIAASRKMDASERRIEGIQIPEQDMADIYDQKLEIKQQPADSFTDVSHLPESPLGQPVGAAGQPDAPF
ncbi:single-stranded DNA-binding protein [Corynebacterium hylobatis]|uniref:Single-stranded DNA-binding protein n=1 Tax=Corynebacterium hylobatis TaxID=1859290 RepID=A0A3S0C0X7_9CORY|nr:single-stranded DNA-binding protein [Corynebacterium hylobatis]